MNVETLKIFFQNFMKVNIFIIAVLTRYLNALANGV